jgi:hypothetical protein
VQSAKSKSRKLRANGLQIKKITLHEHMGRVKGLRLRKRRLEFNSIRAYGSERYLASVVSLTVPQQSSEAVEILCKSEGTLIHRATEGA